MTSAELLLFQQALAAEIATISTLSQRLLSTQASPNALMALSHLVNHIECGIEDLRDLYPAPSAQLTVIASAKH